jgi:hypothetical protein
MFVSSGDIHVNNSTLFANTSIGGPEGAKGCPYAIHDYCAPPAGPGGGDAAGGGLYTSGGSLSLTGVTVASNQALTTSVEPAPAGLSSGGGVANAGATRLVTNTTLIGENAQDSGSTINGADVSGPITAAFSLISQSAGAVITDGGYDIVDVDPLLDPSGLQQNGGPTLTVALQSGSPAIDAGDSTVCAAPRPKGLGGIDQRGYPRFAPGEDLCDIGAFEFGASPAEPSQ